jgi:alginate O-acetyltransferase complex protein AlgI
MLFSSGLFLFAFLPAFLALYFVVPAWTRNSVLVVASLFFYSWTEPTFVFWALGSAILDYTLGKSIARSSSTRWRKTCVAIGATANLSLLAWFKYAVFSAGVFSGLLRTLGVSSSIHLSDIILPVAISFIVFEKITYLVDIYRRTGNPAPNLWTYLLYVFYFPKLLAGPIIRYCDIEHQLTNRSVSLTDFRDGLNRFLFGLAKKVLIADHVANVADQVFSLSPVSLDCPTAWIGVVCFSLQIYFDFSGYSDMAIGLSRALGFRLNENFRNPYLAANFTDFWRRWHISLSTWIRIYLYIPLGGNRQSTARTYFNLCLCFFLSGLWHGAAWPFIFWGIFHGCILILDRSFWLDAQQRLPAAFNCLVTLFFVMISWVIFRSHNVGQMLHMLEAMFSPWGPTRVNTVWISADIATSILVGLFLVFSPAFAPWQVFLARFRQSRWHNETVLACNYLSLLLVIGKISTASFRAFLYFRF